MVETTGQIEEFIEERRERLGSNLEELEGKLKTVTDWRAQFERRPMTWMGAVLAGGVVLGLVSSGRRPSSSSVPGPAAEIPSRVSRASSVVFEGVSDEVTDLWQGIKGALLGVAASRLTDVIGDAVPGFREELGRRGRDRAHPRLVSPGVPDDVR